MKHKDLADALTKMGMDPDTYDREDRLVMLQAAQVLGGGVFKLLHSGYKAGFCDAIAKGIQSTNIHITANNNANAFALSVTKGVRQL